ncbi:hypothetical protein BJ742DRAFT_742952 [Cladochytrium replicatum]|nr:hypothetical protein BJ742DRAFT_742952 [Cladochytrium replicatum]
MLLCLPILLCLVCPPCQTLLAPELPTYSTISSLRFAVSQLIPVLLSGFTRGPISAFHDYLKSQLPSGTYHAIRYISFIGPSVVELLCRAHFVPSIFLDVDVFDPAYYKAAFHASSTLWFMI